MNILHLIVVGIVTAAGYLLHAPLVGEKGVFAPFPSDGVPRHPFRNRKNGDDFTKNSPRTDLGHSYQFRLGGSDAIHEEPHFDQFAEIRNTSLKCYHPHVPFRSEWWWPSRHFQPNRTEECAEPLISFWTPAAYSAGMAEGLLYCRMPPTGITFGFRMKDHSRRPTGG